EESSDSDTGYLVWCDIDMSRAQQDRFKDYPPFFTKIDPSEKVSDFQKSRSNISKGERLCGVTGSVTDYVCDYRVLQFYINVLGFSLKRITKLTIKNWLVC